MSFYIANPNHASATQLVAKLKGGSPAYGRGELFMCKLTAVIVAAQIPLMIFTDLYPLHAMLSALGISAIAMAVILRTTVFGVMRKRRLLERWLAEGNVVCVSDELSFAVKRALMRVSGGRSIIVPIENVLLPSYDKVYELQQELDDIRARGPLGDGEQRIIAGRNAKASAIASVYFEKHKTLEADQAREEEMRSVWAQKRMGLS